MCILHLLFLHLFVLLLSRSLVCCEGTFLQLGCEFTKTHSSILFLHRRRFLVSFLIWSRPLFVFLTGYLVKNTIFAWIEAPVKIRLNALKREIKCLEFLFFFSSFSSSSNKTSSSSCLLINYFCLHPHFLLFFSQPSGVLPPPSPSCGASSTPTVPPSFLPSLS